MSKVLYLHPLEVEHNGFIINQEKIETVYSILDLFTVNFAHSHNNKMEHVCEAISGYFVVLARNCLESMLDYTVM